MVYTTLKINYKSKRRKHLRNTTFRALQEGTPRENRGGGIRGGSAKTRAYREQLQANTGKWFIWKQGTKHGSDTGQALRTLLGTQSLTGLDRSTLAYQATAQKQDDGTYTTFVRFVGEAGITMGATSLPERQNIKAPAPAESNPFGVNV